MTKWCRMTFRNARNSRSRLKEARDCNMNLTELDHTVPEGEKDTCSEPRPRPRPRRREEPRNGAISCDAESPSCPIRRAPKNPALPFLTCLNPACPQVIAVVDLHPAHGIRAHLQRQFHSANAQALPLRSFSPQASPFLPSSLTPQPHIATIPTATILSADHAR